MIKTVADTEWKEQNKEHVSHIKKIGRYKRIIVNCIKKLVQNW